MRDRIQLDPEYQRLSDIWTPDKRQLLVDTILNDFDVPKLYLHKFHEPLRTNGKTYDFSIIDGKQRSADAAVYEDARFAVLSRDNFLSFIQNNPTVALEMLSATFSRLRRTDKMLQQRVSRNVNEEQEKRLTLADRAADVLAEFGGSWKFIGFAVGLILFWIALNSYILVSGFDPLPYQMLNLVLAVVAGMQAPIIMMSQNRQGSKDRLRADLDFQVNLKNELALTEVLRRLDVLESERLPLLFAEQNEKIAELGTTSKASTIAT